MTEPSVHSRRVGADQGGLPRGGVLALGLGGLFLLGALHAVGLDSQSIWLDETTTWGATEDASEVWRMEYAGTERYMRGYLWLVAVARHLAGDSPVALRGNSIVFFWVAMVAGTLLWRRRLGWGTALAWGGVLGVSAYWWQYSHEARPYSLGLAAAMFALFCQEARLAAHSSRWKGHAWDMAMVATIALGVVGNFYVILVWPALVLSDLIFARRIGIRRVVRVHGGLAAALLLLLVVGAIPHGGRPMCVPPPRFTSVPEFAGLLHMLVVGPSWGPTVPELRLAASPAAAVLAHGPWFLVSGLALLAAAWGVVITRAWREAVPETLLGAGTLAALGYLCWREGYAIAPRHLFLATPMFLGWTAVVLRRRPAWALPLVACMVVASLNYLFVPKYGRENWRDAIRVLVGPNGRNHALVFYTNSSPEIFDYYLGRSRGRAHGMEMLPLDHPRAEKEAPDFLVEARTWGILGRPEGSRLARLKREMKPFYSTTGITLWRKPPPDRGSGR